MTSINNATSPVTGDTATENLTESVSFQENVEFTLLTINQFRGLDFELCDQCTTNSWSPKDAFDARELGKVGGQMRYETLHDYLVNVYYREIVASILLELPKNMLPRVDVLLTIYRATDDTCGLSYGSILPGASITTSMAYAKRHADLHLTTQKRIMTMKVYPDELVTHGNPHEFNYIPRSLSIAYGRYLHDNKRQG